MMGHDLLNMVRFVSARSGADDPRYSSSVYTLSPTKLGRSSRTQQSLRLTRIQAGNQGYDCGRDPFLEVVIYSCGEVTWRIGEG